MIRTAVISTAKTYDGGLLPPVAPTDSAAVYADKAYASKANGILKKEAHPIQLTPQDQANNRKKSAVRRHLERILAHLKHWQGYRRVRYLGLAKNQLELTLKGSRLQSQTTGEDNRTAKSLSRRPPHDSANV